MMGNHQSGWTQTRCLGPLVPTEIIRHQMVSTDRSLCQRQNSTMICQTCLTSSVLSSTQTSSSRAETSTAGAPTPRQCLQTCCPCSTCTDCRSLCSRQLAPHSMSAVCSTSSSAAKTHRLAHVAVLPTHHVADHDLVTWSMTTSAQKPPRRMMSYKIRFLKKVNWAKFEADLQHSELFIQPAETADEFAVQLDQITSKLLGVHCPLQKRRQLASTRRDGRWLSAVRKMPNVNDVDLKGSGDPHSVSTTTSPTGSHVVLCCQQSDRQLAWTVLL